MQLDEQKIVNKVGGLAASVCVQTWMNTLDLQGAHYDETVDPVQANHRGPVILVFWHEYLLAPFFLRGRSNTAILTSRHRDAEWLSEAARHMGFVTVRGSTNKGGGRALLKLLRSQGTCNVGIACDGPQGPRRRAAQGPIYLSSRFHWSHSAWDTTDPGGCQRGIALPFPARIRGHEFSGVHAYKSRAEWDAKASSNIAIELNDCCSG